MAPPILQFGTGRFLQAHVDLFVSQAAAEGQALGGIAVVQTTHSPASSARLAALGRRNGYRVELRGLQNGQPMVETIHVDSVHEAWFAERDWSRLLDAVATDVQVIVSNTADLGYLLDDADNAGSLAAGRSTPPRSFPAKLLVLLHHRWRNAPSAPLSIYPCELVSRNGDALRDQVAGLAASWQCSAQFLDYLRQHCVWLNSLVDRIVSAPLEPIGAVAEPYALWAIERQERMVLPCTHPAIVLTDDLAPFEQRKLWLLNLGHTVLAERWLVDRLDPSMTVVQAMNDPGLRAHLEVVWEEEVIPVFDCLGEGEGESARGYRDEVRERFLNPFVEHRLADIAQNHAQKKERRIATLVQRAEALRLWAPLRRLRGVLSR